jgi:pectate lyase
LRDALSAGDRRVVFDVAGDIVLADEIQLHGANITVDGFTAPSPGVTLRGFGLRILNVHDLVVRNLRIRDAAQDGIWVADGSYNVVLDHLSIHGSFDGNLDITRDGTRDVTVCFGLFTEQGGEEKNLLFAFGSTRISLNHNFMTGHQRNPQVTFDDSPARTQDTETTLDMRNNVVWEWGAYGTRIRYGARANVVANYYLSGGGDPNESIIVCKGAATSGDSQCDSDATNTARVFTSDNVSGDGAALNGLGTESVPFPAAITTQSACEAARAVLAGAGARPIDAIDASFVRGIALAGCP